MDISRVIGYFFLTIGIFFFISGFMGEMPLIAIILLLFISGESIKGVILFTKAMAIPIFIIGLIFFCISVYKQSRNEGKPFLHTIFKSLSNDSNLDINKLSEQAITVFIDLCMFAQTITIMLIKNEFITQKESIGSKPTLELIIFYINLWNWYKPDDKLKILFFEKLMACCNSIKSQNEISDLYKNSLNQILKTRSVEYLEIHNKYKDQNDYYLILGKKVYSNMIEKIVSDPKKVMIISNAIIGYLKTIHVTWNKIINNT